LGSVGSANSLRLVKSNRHLQANRFDRIMAIGLLVFYLLMNILFIYDAVTA
jgi:hypothetical protein